MIPTIDFITNKFNVFNKEYFDNSLPLPNFALIQSKTKLGEFVACRRYDMFGLPFVKSTINISTFYDRPEDQISTTIIHEMIHYYIHYRGIEDTSSHGKEWKKIANEINKKGGWDITRTSSTDGCDVNSDIVRNHKKVSEITFMSFERGNTWYSFLVSKPNVEMFQSYLEKNFTNIVIGTVDRNQFQRYSICRKKIYAEKANMDEFKDKVLPFVHITKQVGNI